MADAEQSTLTHFLGATATVLGALLIGLGVFEALAPIRFDLVFFEEISLDQALGSWRYTVQVATAVSFAAFTGLCYYLTVRTQSWPVIVRVVAALGGGVAGVAVLIAIAATLMAMLTVLAMFYALFFGPGDR